MSNLDRIKTAYSGWHKYADESQPASVAAQLDLEAEIERRVAERLAIKKPSKPKLVEPEA